MELLATIPWQVHPKVFRENGRPHVSDMHAFLYLKNMEKILVSSHDKDKKLCGVVSASTIVFGQNSSVDCLNTCSQHAAMSEVSAQELESFPLQGPLAAHLSHGDVRHYFIQASLSDISANSTLFKQYPEIHHGLANLVHGKNQDTFNNIRGKLMRAVPEVYRIECIM